MLSKVCSLLRELYLENKKEHTVSTTGKKKKIKGIKTGSQ